MEKKENLQRIGAATYVIERVFAGVGRQDI